MLKLIWGNGFHAVSGIDYEHSGYRIYNTFKIAFICICIYNIHIIFSVDPCTLNEVDCDESLESEIFFTKLLPEHLIYLGFFVFYFFPKN